MEGKDVAAPHKNIIKKANLLSDQQRELEKQSFSRRTLEISGSSRNMTVKDHQYGNMSNLFSTGQAIRYADRNNHLSSFTETLQINNFKQEEITT